MSELHPRGTLARVGAVCRLVAALLIAGVWRSKTLGEVEARLRQAPARQQALAVGGVLGLVFLCSLFAAQFGWIGLIVFWLGVILIAR